MVDSEAMKRKLTQAPRTQAPLRGDATGGEVESVLVFRRARVGEEGELSAIAWASKAHWGYPAAWMEAWRPHLTLTRKTLTAEQVWVAEIEATGRLAGFFSVRPERGGWWLEHCWLRPEFIGQGWGRLLMAEIRRRARELGASEVCFTADPNAEGFYLKMGAERTGMNRYFLLGTIARELPKMRLPV